MHQLNKIAKWDKLKTWHALKQDIDERLHAQDVSESITIEIGPQLLYTLHHQSALRCIDQTSTIHGEMFTCHYNKGAVHGIRIWNIDYQEHQGVCKHIGFEINSEITCMTYVSRHRAYMFFCSDLTLRAFTDSYSNFEQVGLVPCLSTILCLVYNKDSDEIYAGGIGFIEQWTVMGAEHAVTLVSGRKFHTTLTRNDWIRDIKIVKQDHLMIAQHGNGLCVINLKSGMQLRRLANRHDGPLTCCCYYAASDFLFTGGSDGRIKVFNGTACNLLHTFVAHHGLVTVVEPHRKENLLFSTSHDGTLKVWKLDNLQIVQFMRLDLGEMIFRFSLLRDTEFYLQTEKEIQIYDLNQFYQLFAAVESQTRRLMCCQGKGSPNRILASTLDGSVRLLSPITGLTLTIIYPMPSFQALTSFAYDLHQERLHTVLSSGKVLVYSTTTNPCKAEEIWEAKCQDEKVNILLLVHMEFEIDGQTDCDNLVFAGLENGQIILCDAVVCTLDNRVQAHEGAVVCLENASSHLGGARSLVISGGKDNFVKIWLVGLEVEASRPVVSLAMIIKIYLPARPMHMCMYSNLLWITLRQPSKSGPKWPLIMYKMAQIHCRKNSLYERVPAKFLSKAFMPFQITHSEDEDHVQQVTALDKCSWMKLVVTSGKDGYVKIWSCENLLVREINFASPIYAVCFANIQGDLLVGFGTHICSVSVLTYLPVAHLKKIEAARINFEDEIREKPVKFDYKSEPWLHLDNVRHLSLDIVERRRQHLELEVIDLLKKSTGKNEETKFVIFNDAGTTKVIRKDFADRLLDLSKGIQKLKLNKKIAIFQPFKDKRTEAKLQIKAAKADDKSKDADQIRTIKEEETDYSDTKGLVEIYPSSVGTAFRDLRSQRGRGQETMRLLKEQELLNKDPIIAPDGYIPNSVIRKKLKKRDVPLKQEKPFKLKPVPRVNPQHMPPWWDNQTEEDMEETATSVSGWDDDNPPSEDDTEMSAMQRRYSNQQRTLSVDLESDISPKPSMLGYKGFGKMMSFVQKDLEAYSPESLRRRRLGEHTDTQEKSMKLTDYAVDEDSSAIHVIKDTKRPAVKCLTNLMHHAIIRQLLEEEWFPKMKADFEYKDVLRNLLSVLDVNKSAIFGSACNYITSLYRELGLSDEQLKMIIGELAVYLKSKDPHIRKHVIRTLQTLGEGRTDVLIMVLKLLVDEEESVREAAADCIRVLTGATDKETLLNILEALGITEGFYNSKADEAYTLALLAERFAEHEDPEHFNRIKNWIQGTTPGIYDDKEDDSLQDGMRSGKEHSFMSEGKSGKKVGALTPRSKKDGALTPRSKKDSALTLGSKKDGSLTPGFKKDGALISGSKKDGVLTPGSKATESTLKNKMKDMDGFSTISDRSSSSKKSRMSGRFTPKDHHLYQYYDSQLGTPPGPVPPSLSKLKESENVREAVPDKDSGYSGQTISDIPSSQVTGSSLSTQELGVSRDISEFSHGKLGVSRDMSEVSHGKLGVSGEFSHGKLGVSRDLSEFSHGKPFGKGYPRAALSPVKSEPASPPPKSGPHTPKDWRRFFELVPNAQERKQMELIRREMEAGKLKHHTLPPISYFAEDLPMLPGEAGTRLLQTVRVGEKMQAPGDGRHRIESVPGKLAVHTQNEDAGLSNFGILQMQWTTGVPSVRDRLHPPQRIAQHRNQAMIQEESLLNSANSYNRLRHGLSEEELNLPYIDTASPSMTKRQSADQYEWEYPLPPPPAKESRTQVPMIRRDHENYCKYYHLLKKKLHLYTSKQKERSQHLPEVFVKRLREQGQGQDEKSAAKPRKQTSLTKIDSSLLFPPIKLGQLVKIC